MWWLWMVKLRAANASGDEQLWRSVGVTASVLGPRRPEAPTLTRCYLATRVTGTVEWKAVEGPGSLINI